MESNEYVNTLARVRPQLIPSDYRDLIITNRIKPYQHSWYILRQRKSLVYATPFKEVALTNAPYRKSIDAGQIPTHPLRFKNKAGFQTLVNHWKSLFDDIDPLLIPQVLGHDGIAMGLTRDKNLLTIHPVDPPSPNALRLLGERIINHLERA